MPKYYPPYKDICCVCHVAPRKPGFIKCEKCLAREDRYQKAIKAKVLEAREQEQRRIMEEAAKLIPPEKLCARCKLKERLSNTSYCRECAREIDKVRQARKRAKKKKEPRSEICPRCKVNKRKPGQVYCNDCAYQYQQERFLKKKQEGNAICRDCKTAEAVYRSMRCRKCETKYRAKLRAKKKQQMLTK